MPESKSNSYAGVVLAAPVSLPYVRRSEHGAEWFIGRILQSLLQASGLKKRSIDGLAVSSFTMAPDTTISLSAYFNMSPRWIDFMPTGGSSGIMILRRAARAVQAGDADIVACVAGDAMNANAFRTLINNFSKFSTDCIYPYGAAGPNGTFSLITRNYMEKYGATREDFGKLCVQQRDNALAAGKSLFNKKLTLEDYLQSRKIAGPVHLFDCVMPCAGGEGYLVLSEARAKELSLPFVRVLGASERHNAFSDDDVPYRAGWAVFRDQLYKDARVGSEDIDFFQTYDDYPVVSMMQFEDFGFCSKGEGPEFVRRTDLSWNGGGLPHNVSGGQLSGGQAGAAGGFLGLVEAIRQLSVPGLKNAVPGARVGLVSGYGMVVYDRCLSACAAILERGDSV